MSRSGAGAAFRRLVAQSWAVLALLVGIHLIVALLAYDPVPHSGGDNTAYLALARSLLDRGRYLELWNPARPAHTQYPPGFPALLAVAWTLGLRSWGALKLMMVGFSGAAVGVSYLWMRERTTAVAAAALGFLLAVAPGLAGEGQWVLSDVPFWAVTMATLLAFERGRERPGIALAFLALALRTAALPLLLAVIAALALRRRWKLALGVAAALGAAALLWTLRSSAADAGYVSQLWLENPYEPEAGRVGPVGLLQRMVGNADRYTFTILMRTLAGGVGIVGAGIGALLVAAAMIGLGRRVLGREPPGRAPAGRERTAQGRAGRVGVVEVYTVLYVGMILVWPSQWASDRFLFPILPVLLVYAARGLGAIPRRDARRALQVGGVLAVLGLGVSPLMGLWREAAACRAAVRADGPFACLPPDDRAYIDVAQWAQRKLQEDAVVVARKPRIWYWYSGYPSEVYPFTRDRSRLLSRAAELGARYVVLDELGGSSAAYLLPAVAEYRRRYCAIHRVEREGRAATLLGVLPEPWDPDELGIPGDPQAEPLQVPRCPPVYTPGGDR